MREVCVSRPTRAVSREQGVRRVKSKVAVSLCLFPHSLVAGKVSVSGQRDGEVTVRSGNANGELVGCVQRIVPVKKARDVKHSLHKAQQLLRQGLPLVSLRNGERN